MKNFASISTTIIAILDYAANPETAAKAAKAGDWNWPDNMNQVMAVFLVILGIAAIIAGVKWILEKVK